MYRYAERLGIEAMSRDRGHPNCFVTFNTDARNWDHSRRLVYKLEQMSNPSFGDPEFELWYPAIDRWTELVDKHAAFLVIYLQRVFETFFEAFFCDVCGVPKQQPTVDYTKVADRTSPQLSWYWNRVEFTETRGMPHWHGLVKLPHVLDTGLIGRVIQNGRLAREELVRGNVKPDMMDRAWQIIQMGLIADRYAILFVNSVQKCSFYARHMDAQEHNEKEIIALQPLVDKFVENYTQGNITPETHPIMRTPAMDAISCPTVEEEVANIAAVAQVHRCLPNSCGGDAESGKGCRFDFPKKNMQKNVVAVVQVFVRLPLFFQTRASCKFVV